MICVILAAVLGGVLGSRAANDDDDDSKDNQSMPNSQTGSDNKPSNLVGVFPQSVFDAASNAAKQGNTDDIAYYGTYTYGNPVFTSSGNKNKPSFGKAVGKCEDPWKPTNNLNNGRPGHPRLIAPGYMWDLSLIHI